MINKDKIIFNTHTYFTCSYTGAIGIKILKLFEDGCVLVKNKGGTFVRPLMYVYNTEDNTRKLIFFNGNKDNPTDKIVFTLYDNAVNDIWLMSGAKSEGGTDGWEGLKLRLYNSLFQKYGYHYCMYQNKQ